MKNLSNLSEQKVKQKRESVKEENHVILTDDNARLFLRSWEPKQRNKTAILILHGITAHSRPYEVIANPLNKAGYQVYGLDLRGHGLSSGNRGDYDSEETLLGDLEDTLSYIRITLNFDKIVLLGHSLGVLTSLKVLHNNIGNIDGIALFSAAQKVKEGIRNDPSLWEKLKIYFSSLFFPGKPVITYYREGMQGVDDPLFNFQYSLRFFQIFDEDTIELPIDVDYPVYMAIGDEDELFEVQASKDLFEKIKAEDKTFEILEDSKHAEFAEGAFDGLVDWLQQRFD